jgi:hypothetical protein
MVTIRDLPLAAVQQIIQLARGRIIAGTNGFSAVCQQWRDAGGNSSSEGSEQLQLFLDLADMSEAAISRALGWLAQHGKQTGVLVIAAGWLPGVTQDRLYMSLAALSNLQRLELQQQDSLLHLAPVLGQLPQLQHLEARVTMKCVPESEEVDMDSDGVDGQGAFVDFHGLPFFDLPDLQQQLCPRLIHLRLLVDTMEDDDIRLDDRLPELLPARLQQLELVAVDKDTCSMLPSHFLSHLTALQQLTLQGIEIVLDDWEQEDRMEVLEQHLAGVRDLQVLNHGEHITHDPVLQQLAPKITDYSSCFVELDADTAARLARLTRLGFGGSLGQPTIAAMAGLQLQELALVAVTNSNLVAAAQLAGGMPTLRRLQLVGDVTTSAWQQEQLSTALGTCSQLTSLHLDVELNHTSAAASGACRHLPVPTQLVELRCLAVPAPLLQQEAGAWLAPLTALKHLYLDLPHRVPQAAEQQGMPSTALLQGEVQGVLQQVQEWPASLQQVVVWVRPNSNLQGPKRMAWEYAPAAPAGGRFNVWVEVQGGKAEGWARPLSPCPHLPGAWELQGPSQSRPLSLA